MKTPIPGFWLYLCLVGLLALLGLSYAFQWTAMFRILPWFFILLCPLMMLMAGHGGDHSGRSQKPVKPPEDSSDPQE